MSLDTQIVRGKLDIIQQLIMVIEKNAERQKKYPNEHYLLYSRNYYMSALMEYTGELYDIVKQELGNM